METEAGILLVRGRYSDKKTLIEGSTSMGLWERGFEFQYTVPICMASGLPGAAFFDIEIKLQLGKIIHDAECYDLLFVTVSAFDTNPYYT